MAALGIPPAYNDVSLSISRNYPIQAKALAPNGKIQYYYSQEWKISRERSKFRKARDVKKMKKLYEISRKERTTNPTALVVFLLFKTCQRIGGQSSSATGISTLRLSHVKSVNSAKVNLRFKGKSGVIQKITVNDPVFIKFIRKILKSRKKGYVFENVSESKANAYIKSKLGEGFSCKTVRTYMANKVYAQEITKGNSKTSAIKKCAEALGNSATVCKNHYIDPKLTAA